MPGKEIVPPEMITGLPAPTDFRRMLIEKLEADIAAVRFERGDVTQPEDTYALVRQLTEYEELAGEYARHLTGAVKIARQEREEELITAVGEQAGVPNGGLTVPAANGDIRLSLDHDNTHVVDQEILFSAVAGHLLADPDSIQDLIQLAVAAAVVPDEADILEQFLADMLIHAQRKLTQLGNFKGQISKVQAFAKEQARGGADGVAGMLNSSITTTTNYKGVKASRTQEKNS